MTTQATTYHGGKIFDGETLHTGQAVRVQNGAVTHIGDLQDLPTSETLIDLGGEILSPGYVDLQVNGGDGVLLNDAPSVDTFDRIARAHRRLGATTILPTLITDTAAQTRSAIDTAVSAVEQGMTGIGGLHLEGPHLSIARKGAHDAALIRAMTDADLNILCAAAQSLPVLFLTIAPENVTLAQVRTLREAGAILSLGHSDADFETCMSYADAGVTCVTHLFNAMSQLGNRQPGLVGAALSHPGLSAGLIADGIHVHPATMTAALAAKRGPGQVFLVSDAMAPAGTDQTEFTLNGRCIQRSEGRLTLEDGTLAGADLDLTTALRVLTSTVGVPLDIALQMATSAPASVVPLPDGTGQLRTGTRTHQLIRISADLTNCVPLVK